MLFSIMLMSCLFTSCGFPETGERASEENDTSAMQNETFSAFPTQEETVAVLSVTRPVPVSPMVTPSVTIILTSPVTLTPSTTPAILAPLTPLPTVPERSRGQAYLELMTSNRGCELPCWWGFEPGEDSIDSVRQFYESFAPFVTERPILDDLTALYVTFVDPQIENGIQVRHTLVAQKSVFIEAEIEAFYAPVYQIEPLLQRLGMPDDVWMWTIPEAREGVLPMSLILYYPEQGVLISYAAFAERIDDMVTACFEDTGGTTLLLWNPEVWDPDDTKSLVDRVDESALSLDGYRPLAEVSNWGSGQFYASLVDSAAGECLETPADLWPPP